MKRRTIKKRVELSGTALHSGAVSKMTFLPAECGRGIVFVRADLPSRPEIPALAENVSDTTRGTTLGVGQAGAQVVEHVLAAISALGISDIIIEMYAGEPPAMDGSALPFFKALKDAGAVDLKEENQPLAIQKEVTLQDGDSVIRACPSDRFSIGFMINFPGTPIGAQEFSLEVSGASFEKEIAPARTFGFIEEIEELKKNGLALGASPDNALAVSKKGYVNKPRFKDEAVRHKILDLIGDLALVGRPIAATITAERSGHKLNTKFARMLREKIQ
jgi:UDP-3-O-acyl N-acetylglucosamine deacetylase